MLRVMTVLGTRPEIIRLSRVIPLLDKHTHHILVHTSQNYDPQLNEVFFKEMKIRPPDHYMQPDKSSLAGMIADIFKESEMLMRDYKPEAVLILGDTNSALSAIIAKRMRIPVYHMEAGNRSWDQNVPEEINRKIVDHISDFNLPYTEHARRNLIAEGIPPRRIILSGSPMYEVLNHYEEDISKSDILNKLQIERKDYFIVSAHREENVDHPGRLNKLVDTLHSIAKTFQRPIIISTHPRTKNRLQHLGISIENELIRFLPPFGFFDYIFLQQNALCAVSDSGTISEEAAILNFPAITIRNSMERPEALDAGSITLSGLEPEMVVAALREAIEEYSLGVRKRLPIEYFIPDTSYRVLRLILGTARLSHKWSGIDMPGQF